jgi:energy-converting hydrogenase Eha subunit C
VCISQIVHFALLQEGVILVLVAAGGSAHSAAAGAEVIFVIFEVVCWVRREGGFALGCEGGI